MNVNKLIDALKRYIANRRQPSWNKMADVDAVFDEMIALGLNGISASAGTFIGNMPNGEVVIASTDNDKIFIGVGEYLHVFENLKQMSK